VHSYRREAFSEQNLFNINSHVENGRLMCAVCPWNSEAPFFLGESFRYHSYEPKRRAKKIPISQHVYFFSIFYTSEPAKQEVIPMSRSFSGILSSLSPSFNQERRHQTAPEFSPALSSKVKLTNHPFLQKQLPISPPPTPKPSNKLS
jgi:hypothetical protein